METTQLQYCRFCGEQKEKSELIDFSQNQQVYDDVYVKLYFINADYVSLDDEMMPKTICRFCYQTFDRTHSFLANVKKVQQILRVLFHKTRVKVESSEQIVDLTSRASTPDSPRMVIDESPNVDSTFRAEEETVAKWAPLIDLTEPVVKRSSGKDSKPKANVKSQLLKKQKKVLNAYVGPRNWLEYRWLCPHCEERFANVLRLQLHCTSIHKKFTQYRCSDCKKTITDYDKFIKHAREHHRTLRLRCDYCHLSFCDNVELRLHRLRHLIVIDCKFCLVSFKSYNQLSEHLVTCAQHKLDSNVTTEPSPRITYNEHINKTITKEKPSEKRRVAKKRTTVIDWGEPEKPKCGDQSISKLTREIETKEVKNQANGITENQTDFVGTSQSQMLTKPHVEQRTPPGNIRVPPSLLQEISHLYKSKPPTEPAIQVPPALLEEILSLCKSKLVKDQANDCFGENRSTRSGNNEKQAFCEALENQGVPESSSQELPDKPNKPTFSENNIQSMSQACCIKSELLDCESIGGQAKSITILRDQARENNFPPERSKSVQNSLSVHKVQSLPVSQSILAKIEQNQSDPGTIHSENGYPCSNKENQIKAELLDNNLNIDAGETTQLPSQSTRSIPPWAIPKVKVEHPENHLAVVEPIDKHSGKVGPHEILNVEMPNQVASAAKLLQTGTSMPELPKKLTLNSCETQTDSPMNGEVTDTETTKVSMDNKTHPSNKSTGFVQQNFLKLPSETLDELARSRTGKLAVGIMFLNQDITPSLKRLLTQAATSPNRRAKGLKELLLTTKQIPPVLNVGNTPENMPISNAKTTPTGCKLGTLELDYIIGVSPNEIKAVYKSKKWTSFFLPYGLPNKLGQSKNSLLKSTVASSCSTDSGLADNKTLSFNNSQQISNGPTILVGKQAMPLAKYGSNCYKERSPENSTDCSLQIDVISRVPKRKQEEPPWSRKGMSKIIKLDEANKIIPKVMEKSSHDQRIITANVGSIMHSHTSAAALPTIQNQSHKLTRIITANVGSIMHSHTSAAALPTIQNQSHKLTQIDKNNDPPETTLQNSTASTIQMQNIPIFVPAANTIALPQTGTAIEANEAETLAIIARNSSNANAVMEQASSLLINPEKTSQETRPSTFLSKFTDTLIKTSSLATEAMRTEQLTNKSENLLNQSKAIKVPTQTPCNVVNTCDINAFPTALNSRSNDTESQTKTPSAYEQVLMIPISGLTTENQAKVMSALPKHLSCSSLLPEYLNVPVAMVPPHLQTKLKDLFTKCPDPDPNYNVNNTAIDSLATLPNANLEKCEQFRELQAISERESRPKVPVLVQKAVDKSWSGYGWSCGLCESTFESASDLREHCKIQHATCFMVRCLDCGEVEESFTRFVAHVGLHRKFLQLSCPYCNLKVEKATRDRHIHGHKTRCRKCGDTKFESLAALSKHIFQYAQSKCFDAANTDHDVQGENGARGTVKRPTYRCEKCTEHFPNFRVLNEHMSSHKRAREYICDYCKKGFLTRLTVRRHIHRKHSSDKPRPLRLKTIYTFRERDPHETKQHFCCEFCTKVYTSLKSYKKHLRCLHQTANEKTLVELKTGDVPAVLDKMQPSVETDQPDPEELQP